MASRKEYLDYILGQLDGLEGIAHRAMMGEYLLYHRGKVFGGIYDDRFLVKRTQASCAVLHTEQIPYEGGSPMLFVDSEDVRAIADMVVSMATELPAPKKR